LNLFNLLNLLQVLPAKLFKCMKRVISDLIFLYVYFEFREVNAKDYDKYLKKVGGNLRKIRKEKGYSMESLANETEMEYRQLGRIERGEINTSIISLLRICNTLNIEIKDLFEE